MDCTYCSEDVPRTSGKMLVKNNGKRAYFCSSKCQKNWTKNRNLKYKEKKA